MSTQAMTEKIAEYFKTQPVLKAWLFGSFARGEETADSDVDILVEYDKNARISLLTISHMMGEFCSNHVLRRGAYALCLPSSIRDGYHGIHESVYRRLHL